MSRNAYRGSVFVLDSIADMAKHYRKPLPKLEVVRAAFPEQFAELDALTSAEALETFGAKARSRAGEGWEQIARYAAIREMQERYKPPAQPPADQYLEDCVTERVWVAVFYYGRMDPKTKRLVAQYGFLGGMIEQLKPLAKIGAGNFRWLAKEGLADCSAEFCVWKWGLDRVGDATRKSLTGLAIQYGFDKSQ